MFNPWKYQKDNRRQNKQILADAGIHGQHEIQPGMVFKMGDNGLLIVDSTQMVEEPVWNSDKINRRRYLIYTRIYKSGKTKRFKTQISNIYNRVIREVIIGKDYDNQKF